MELHIEALGLLDLVLVFQYNRNDGSDLLNRLQNGHYAQLLLDLNFPLQEEFLRL